MGTNIAARRAAKAQRRKAIVSVKRKSGLLTGSLAGRVRLAATQPFQHCLLSGGVFKFGMGTLHVARGASRGRFVVASFLLDSFALGVKDAFLREYDADEFAAFLGTSGAVDPTNEVEPAYARKLLRDLVAWSASQGYGPPEDFAVLEGIFGTVRADECETDFDFGLRGRPLLMPGPNDTPASLRHYRERLAGTGRQGPSRAPLALVIADEA